MARSLTARQQEVYQFIRERIEQRGYGPTVREIGEFLKIKSPNGVMCHLKALQRKGMISRTANKSRSIEVIDRHLSDAPVCLPIHGKVESRACSMFTAPQSLDVIGMLQRPECYLLQYSGDDLHDYAIADGDILIIEHASARQTGVLALVRLDDGSIELSAEPNLPHIVRMSTIDKGPAFTAAEPCVIGIVIGLFRAQQPTAHQRRPHMPQRTASC